MGHHCICSSPHLSGACEEDFFACGDGACVPDYYKCDAYSDCLTGADEMDCGHVNNTGKSETLRYHLVYNPLSTRPHQNVVWYNNSWLGFLKILNYVPKEREKYTAKSESSFVTVKFMLWWLIGIILGKIICESSNWQHTLYTKIEDHNFRCKLATF